MERYVFWWVQKGGWGELRQHRKRLSNELNVNLKPRPLDSAVALFKKFSSIQEVG